MTKQIAILGLVTTMYIVMSLAIPVLSFGMVQFRFGEILMVLPFINKKYSISLILGCLIVNLYSPLGMVDVFFGTSATALVCLFCLIVKNNWMIPIIAGVVNGVIIGLELYYVLEVPASLEVIMLCVGAGEAVTVALGVIIFDTIKKKNKYSYDLIENI